MEMSCLEMAQRGFLYDMDDFSSQASTQLLKPMPVLHLNLMVSYQHLLRPNSSLLLFGLKKDGRRGWVEGSAFPYPNGFLTDTVNTGPLKGHTVCHPWAPARSSPLININGYCTKWGLLTRG